MSSPTAETTGKEPRGHELRGHIADVLARSGLSVSYTLGLIQRRANGASSEQLLAAAIMILREQHEQITWLETEVAELTDANDRLMVDVADLEAGIEALLAKPSALPPAGAA
jgi:hypothetical protein